VDGVLPEHYQSSYPKLIEFLELYYEFLREHPEHNFDDVVSKIITNHDISDKDNDQIKYKLQDLTVGLDFSQAMTDLKTKGSMFNSWYKTKGSLYSIEVFFRWLFDQTVEVEYGKNSVFMLNSSESTLGADSKKYIKNDKLYQTFALLIKVGIPGVQWRDLYKKFCHPAGFYFQSYIILESIGRYSISTMERVLPPDADTIETSFDLDYQTTSSVTGLFADGTDADTQPERVNFLNISTISEVTIGTIVNRTDTIAEFLGPNSPTFDSQTEGNYFSPRMSSGWETMDEDRFDTEATNPDGSAVVAGK